MVPSGSARMNWKNWGSDPHSQIASRSFSANSRSRTRRPSMVTGNGLAVGPGITTSDPLRCRSSSISARSDTNPELEEVRSLVDGHRQASVGAAMLELRGRPEVLDDGELPAVVESAPHQLVTFGWQHMVPSGRRRLSAPVHEEHRG